MTLFPLKTLLQEITVIARRPLRIPTQIAKIVIVFEFHLTTSSAERPQPESAFWKTKIRAAVAGSIPPDL